MSATYAPATATERRTSLSRGPALIVGTILLAAGLYFMYRQHTYPRWSNFPNGGAPVDRHALGIFGINGFTGMLTAICGGLLLFGAAQHHLAKTMSLLVGVALGAAAIIALISGNVLGLAAANGWTELAWGIAAAILLINAMLPARRRVVEPAVGRTAGAGAVAGAAAGDMTARRQTRRTAATEDPAYAGTNSTAGTGTAAGAGTGVAAGAGTGAGTGAGAVPAGEGGRVAEDRDVSYTHRITGDGAADQPAEGEPVGVGGREMPTQNMPTQGTQTMPAQGAQTTRSGNGGGALSRLFGRRN
ncbi:MAG TPA: hypothetical protein VG405_11835 [Solirubrobacteraceae bacterium]|nr:hypothetical protein [Solirubrobacteraceae bacterium]